MRTKICNTCGEEKLIECFRGCYSNNKLYYRNKCNVCDSAYQSETRREYRKQRYLKMKEYYKEHNRINLQTEHGKYLRNIRNNKYREMYPLQHEARQVINYLIRNGKLKKGRCEFYGCECCGRIEAHHDDYTKPLNIRWVCVKHHNMIHNSI